MYRKREDYERENGFTNSDEQQLARSNNVENPINMITQDPEYLIKTCRRKKLAT